MRLTKDLLCDFGMPVVFKGALYNCRVFVLNGEILLIRPKLFLAHNGNYRENRYFKEWPFGRELLDFTLPDEYRAVINQK